MDVCALLQCVLKLWFLISQQDQDDRPQWQRRQHQRMDQPEGSDGVSSGGMGSGQGDISDDLMMKVRQQQQLLDFEKKREAQQKVGIKIESSFVVN